MKLFRNENAWAKILPNFIGLLKEIVSIPETVVKFGLETMNLHFLKSNTFLFFEKCNSLIEVRDHLKIFIFKS